MDKKYNLCLKGASSNHIVVTMYDSPYTPGNGHHQYVILLPII